MSIASDSWDAIQEIAKILQEAGHALPPYWGEEPNEVVKVIRRLLKKPTTPVDAPPTPALGASTTDAVRSMLQHEDWSEDDDE